MAEFKIDRIRFRWTGPWQTSKQYIKDDIVSYGGKTFVCLNGHTSDPDFYIDYLNQEIPKWTQMTDGYQWVQDWVPNRYYKVNDIVKYGGELYSCIVGHDSTEYEAPDTITTINVTVGYDTGRYTTTGYAKSSTGSIYLNNFERNVITFQKGSTYTFSQTDTTNVTFGGQEHPLAFSKYEDGANQDTPLVDYYTDGFTFYLDGTEVTDSTYVANFAEASSREIRWTVPQNAPDKLYYFDRTVNSLDKGSYINVQEPAVIGANDFGNWRLQVSGHNWRYEWQPQVIYRIGDVVKYNGIVYRCTLEHTSSTTISGLELDQPKWQTVTRSDDWKDIWTPRTRYRKDDIVRYGGIVYRCLTGHLSSNNDGLGLEEDSSEWEILISGIEYKGHWIPSSELSIDSLTGGIVTVQSHIFQTGDMVEYSSEGTVASGLTDNTFYYVRLVDGNNITLHFRKNDALADRNPINVEGGTGNQILIKHERYKVGDIVRFGPSIWRCNTGHNSSITFAESFFDIWLPGYEYELQWNEQEVYQPGDIVKYGGYSYTSLTINTNSVPSVNGITQDTGDWELTTQGYRMGGQYNQNPDDQEIASYWDINTNYRTGDVVRFGGWLYVALRDSQGSEPDDELTTVNVAITVGDPGSGNKYYVDGVEQGNLTLVEGNTYKFDQSDSSNLTHPLYLSTSVDGFWDGGQYNFLDNGVTYWLDGIQVADATAYDSGFAAATERYVQYIVPRDAYKENYLVCYNHSGMYNGTLTTIYSNNYWQTLIDGDRFRGNWQETFLVNAAPVANNYFLGDIVTYNGTLYRCMKRHTASQSASRPDLDIEYTQENFWQTVIEGGNSNVLQYRGDVRTYTSEEANLNIGNPGDAIKVLPSKDTTWESLEESKNVFYVSPDGQDISGAGTGLTKTNPFKSVKFACNYIFEDQGLRTPATIIVATGRYEEICPISVPANVAIVGDELRSTHISPTPETKDEDMFRVRNGCGLRNMTLSGLEGELTDPDEFLFKRVSPGNAFVALDPGTGPDDETVWITTKSTYVQNVSTFGKQCVGMKVDGDLHNGGNKSIVANDFTQIIQDGIGYWCNADGLSELVSVFTYYCYIGYLCTNGGKVRATNGNNSYGEYGSVAIGYNFNETPITAKVDNYSKEAEVGKVYNDENQLFAVGYTNTGNHYTGAEVSVTGSGEGASGRITEIRNGSVTEIRILDPGDSSRAGGYNYTYANNRAQGGDETYIQIANQDVNNEDFYRNKQITIVEGEGRGQYAYIDTYDWLNGGVLNVQVNSAPDVLLSPGTYTDVKGTSSNTDAVEPTFTIDIDGSGVATVTAITELGQGNKGGDIITILPTLIGNSGSSVIVEILAVTPGSKDVTVKRPVDNQPGWQHYLPGQPIATVLDETTRYEITPRLVFDLPPYSQNSASLPAGVIKDTCSKLISGNNITVIVGTNLIARTTDGTTFNDATSYTDLNYVSVAQTLNGFIAIDGNGRIKISADGNSWGDSTGNLLSYGLTFTKIAYGTDYDGNNINIAIADSTTNIYKSADGGNNWTQVNAGVSNAKWIAYGNGKWIAVNESGDTWESVDNGDTWTSGTNIGDVQHDVADFCFGNGRFLASCYDSPNDLSTVNNKFFYSFTDKVTDASSTVWIAGNETGVADNIFINYCQGTFLGITESGSIVQSDDGVFWTDKTTAGGTYVGMGYGVTDDGPIFYPYTADTVSSIETIKTGATARATCKIDGSRITEFYIQEPGSGYGQNPPTLSIIDPDATTNVNYDVRMKNGTVGQIEFTNRGTGYINIGVTITGDGYADLYQLGTSLVVKNLTREPGPGDNLYIDEINDQFYAVQGVKDLTGTEGNFEATLTISPSLDRAESPEHETNLTIRQQYSQVRLTGHDFLEIGKGNLYTSQYPLLTPIEGYDIREFQETDNAGGGRVFYTSTDQDGNFRVGELFKVEQATGIVSLNASYFELDGLSELRLGGVTLGGTNAVIREFSTDPTFAANSNEIIPTQRAIAGYVDSRISGGGTNVNVNAVISGEVRIQGRRISSDANRKININTQMNFRKPVDGDMAAMAYFAGGTNFGLIDEGDAPTPQEMGAGK